MITNSFLTVYESCTFGTTVNMGATGATKVTNATTLDLCLSACKNSATCVAVEYSETEKCWMHTTSTYEANLKTNTGVTVYKRVSCGV